jgi:hypothetical protein
MIVQETMIEKIDAMTTTIRTVAAIKTAETMIVEEIGTIEIAKIGTETTEIVTTGTIVEEMIDLGKEVGTEEMMSTAVHPGQIQTREGQILIPRVTLSTLNLCTTINNQFTPLNLNKTTKWHLSRNQFNTTTFNNRSTQWLNLSFKHQTSKARLTSSSTVSSSSKRHTTPQ